MQKFDFRAFDKQNRILIDHAQNGYDIFFPQTNVSTNISFEMMLNDGNYVIDQFLGISDAKGIPIFANDIVENINNHKKFVVKYRNCSFVLQEIEENTELPSEYLSSFRNLLKVIGNIHVENLK